MRVSTFSVLIGIWCLYTNADTTLNYGRVSQKAKEDFQAIIAQQISRMFVRNLAGETGAPKKPVLPEYPPVWYIDNLDMYFDYLYVPGVINGHAHLRNAELSGLDTVVDNVQANVITFTLTHDVTSESLNVFGDYESNVFLDSTDVTEGIPVVGTGHLNASVSGLTIKIITKFLVNLITNKVTTSSVVINATLNSAHMTAENLLVCNQQVDWDFFNENSKHLFDWFWAENRVEVETTVKTIIGWLIQNCNVTEFGEWFMGDLTHECIGRGRKMLPTSPGNPNTFLSAAVNYFAPLLSGLIDCDQIPTTTTTTTTMPPTTTTSTSTPPTATTTTTTTEEPVVDCSDGMIRLIPDPLCCESFIFCFEGEGTKNRCPEGKLFSTTTLQCEDADSVRCKTTRW